MIRLIIIECLFIYTLILAKYVHSLLTFRGAVERSPILPHSQNFAIPIFALTVMLMTMSVILAVKWSEDPSILLLILGVRSRLLPSLYGTIDKVIIELAHCSFPPFTA
jgi:hypothetical protein